jgi:hypothetical protein
MKKLIEHYQEWAEEGRLPSPGLCSSIDENYEKTLGLFEPTKKDIKELKKSGYTFNFWGYNGSFYDRSFLKYYGLTPLRETIILLICAMHDEI